ncbi:helix-turn-helix transcriptional regulator [Actinacidiphila acidipaludis]|uniref:Helix-turn-helix transcriptional regulator n=1 Tax=Actinacidiphila acidipaludis TaxID=2873382 RepID=A0ABS7QK97_9ACTN|nr:helix-turn-helix transcriptional regulator [Streptomyces acidipaludis]MBY8883114.1 helix-turn-helix transcriptional regulator [Streptomyces acidipaludis]
MDRLGAALRAWRDRLEPAAVGLAHGSPRRVPGLRRAEVAALAGISVEYVVRLEQGRAGTPSAQVCSSLARALQLSDDEHAHLLRMAGHAADPGRVPRMIPGSLHRIVDQLAGNPLAVYDATWQLLHWNPLFAATFGDPAAPGAGDRNVLVRQFLGELPRVRQTATERAAFEESLVADLRATTSRYLDDPDLAALVSRLRHSPRFGELWSRRAVGGHQSAHKRVRHPDVGDIALNSDILNTQDTNLRLVVYAPQPGTGARSKLELLAAIGVQSISSSQG